MLHINTYVYVHIFESPFFMNEKLRATRFYWDLLKNAVKSIHRHMHVHT